MARQQTFHSQHRPDFRGRWDSEQEQGGQQYGNEEDWRGRQARGDDFSARDEGSGYRGGQPWDNDRYGYPEARGYGRESSRFSGREAPAGRFAYDPYQQEQRSLDFGGVQVSRGSSNQGSRGGRDWSSEQFGGSQYQRDYPQDFGGRERDSGAWNRRDPWGGPQQHGGNEEFTPYGDWHYQSQFGSQGYAGQEQQARRTPKGFTRSDERIRDDVCEQLYHRSQDLDVSNVSVEVKGGTVTLEGTVPDRRMKHRIEDICEQCLGVSDVENHVRVSREESKTALGGGEDKAGDGNARKGSSSARH